MTGHTVSCESGEPADPSRVPRGAGHGPGELRVVLPAGALEAADLQVIVERLTDRSEPAASVIVFDFSAVDELAGPWSAHLALLIHLSKRLGCEVRATGLHGQPADVVWLYRNSPEVRALLGARPPIFPGRAA